MKQLLDPEAVKRSIREALCLTGECSASIARVKGFIANLPSGSLHIHRSTVCHRFYHFAEGREVYLSKKSPLLYAMCRKRYLSLLLHALELRNELYLPQTTSRQKISVVRSEFDSAVDNIILLLEEYFEGNLDIARIVLTSRQYKWYSGKYSKKNFPSDSGQYTKRNIHVRSKSERDLGNRYEYFGVPYHYEEMITINAANLVRVFHNELAESGLSTRSICYEKNGVCYWNVPPPYQSMNSPGSIWRSYKPNTGKIIIFNDFHIMFADGDLFIHEHEGLLENFKYRINASERIYVMQITGAVSTHNLLTTSESDIQNMDEIIRRLILPRLWF